MKQLSTLLIFLLSLSLSAQNYYINEDFNSGSLPVGWTNTANTGTNIWQFGIDGSSDHPGNQNLDGTSFVYFDDSFFGNSSTNDNTSLETPAFDNASAPITYLEFDYNFRNYQIGSTDNIPDSFYVEVFDGTNWNLVFSRKTDDCGNYISSCVPGFPHATVNISAYSNSNCKVRFTYFDGNDWAWHVGIDDVEIYSPFADDIGIAEILTPTNGCGLNAAETVTIKIKNYGGQAQNNFNVNYQLNGGVIITENVSQSLATGDSLIYTFATTANLSIAGNYSLAAFTSLSSDSAKANDSLSDNIQSLNVYSSTYNESFEQGTGGWTTYGTNNSWARGIPSSININSAPNGNYVFATNPSGNYSNYELSYLESPCFDFSLAIGDPILSFFIFYNLENTFDQLWLEYTDDLGQSWTKVNSNSFSINWYNINGLNHWSGQSSKWLSVEHRLIGFGGKSQIKFRFVFVSDGAIVYDGVAIDNFSIRDQQPIDLTVRELVYPNLSTTPECGYHDESIIIEVENVGKDTISTYDISYQVDGGTIVTETITNPILPNATTTHIFNQQYNFSAVKSHDLDVWVSAIGDGFSLNDSILNTQIINSSVSNSSTTISQNFDSWTVGTVFSNLNDTIGDNWTRNVGIGLNNQYTWRVGEGTINRSGNTGPDRDQNTNGNGGYFMYTEASTGSLNDTATLTSPCIDFRNANNARLSFWWHRYVSNISSPIMIDVYDGNRWINNIDNVSATPQNSSSDPWLRKIVNLDSYVGRIIKIRFRAIRGFGYKGDMAIDNVQIWEPINQDAGLESVGVERCFADSSARVKLSIFNDGIQDILSNSLSVNVQANNGPILTETIAVRINSGDTVDYQLLQNLTIDKVPATVKAWTTLLNDSNLTNDTAVFEYVIDDIETFEQDEISNFDLDTTFWGWYNDNGSNLNWNILTGNYPNGALGPNSDHTFGVTGNGNYTFTDGLFNSTHQGPSILVSPCINLSNKVDPKISYWYHMFGGGNSYLNLEASIDGVNWILLDSLNGPVQQFKTSLYLQNIVSITDSNLLNQEFQIRFVADRLSGNQISIALDDISFITPEGIDLEMKEIVGISAKSCPDSRTPVSVKLYNRGLNALDFSSDTVFITSSIVGIQNASLRDTIYDNSINGGSVLASGDSITFFLDSVDLSSIGTYLIFSTLSMSSDGNSQNNVATKSFVVNNPRSGTLTSNNSNPCIGDTIILSLNNSHGQVEWQSYNGQSWNAMSSIQDTSLMYLVNGNALVRTISCGTEISDTLSIVLGSNCPVGLDKVSRELGISIFPNPTTGLINIEWESNIHDIIVSNQLGQEVVKVNVDGRSQAQINLDGKPGIYFIRFVSDKQHEVHKVVKY